MSTNRLDCRFERMGSSLPGLQSAVKALWHPLVYDWVVTLFSLGYAVIVMGMGANALHLGIYKGPIVATFSPYALAFAGTMLVAAVMGMVGLARLNKSWRMKSSFFLVLAYAWVGIYYIKVVPLPWQAVFVYAFHGLMEAVVYLRCATDPRHLWEARRG